MKYQKSQIGWAMIWVFLPIIVLLGMAYQFQWGNNPIPLIPFIVLMAVLSLTGILFYKLTVSFDGTVLKLTFGIGLVVFNFKIDELIHSEVIKTPWYYGLGIHFTPKGTLYNVHGFKALMINYRSGHRTKKLLVGSAEPEKLKSVLDSHFHKVDHG